MRTTINTITKEVFTIFKDNLMKEKGDWLKHVSEALSAFVQDAINGTVATDTILAASHRSQEIVRYAGQSEELARLASQALE